MEKLTVFVIVVLLAIVRGLLQRRQVAKDLEERLAKARGRSKAGLLGKRRSAPEIDDDAAESGRQTENRDLHPNQSELL